MGLPVDVLTDVIKTMRSSQHYDKHGFNEGLGYQCVALVKEYARALSNGGYIGLVPEGGLAAVNLSHVRRNGVRMFRYINRYNNAGYYAAQAGDIISTGRPGAVGHTFILTHIRRDEKGNIIEARGLEQAGLTAYTKTNGGRIKVKDENGRVLWVDAQYEENLIRTGVKKVEENILDDEGNVVGVDRYYYDPNKIKFKYYKNKKGEVIGQDVTIGLSSFDATKYMNDRKSQIEVAQVIYNFSQEDIDKLDYRGDTTIGKKYATSESKEDDTLIKYPYFDPAMRAGSFTDNDLLERRMKAAVKSSNHINSFLASIQKGLTISIVRRNKENGGL